MTFDQLHPDDQATALRLHKIYASLENLINDDSTDQSQTYINAICRVQEVILSDLQRLYDEAV